MEESRRAGREKGFSKKATNKRRAGAQAGAAGRVPEGEPLPTGSGYSHRKKEGAPSQGKSLGPRRTKTGVDPQIRSGRSKNRLVNAGCGPGFNPRRDRFAGGGGRGPGGVAGPIVVDVC